jgi:ubiquinone/menaquinone biosynthesis C-methylase UbiE
MNSESLGLPLEYQKLPQYFNAVEFSEDPNAKNVVIEKLLKKHNVKTVLDLTCGTGSQVFFLVERGYNVTGADFSPDLLKIARERAAQEDVDVVFIDGDMRTIQVGMFDAVITIANAVGHLTKADFAQAVRNIHQNLNIGGVYVFDIFNLGAMTDSVVAKFACYVHKQVGDVQVLATQCSTIDRSTGLLTSYDSLMIQKNAEKPEQLSNVFSLQLYTAQELQQMLSEAGFEVVAQYGLDGSKFVDNKTLSILTVARKKSG